MYHLPSGDCLKQSAEDVNLPPEMYRSILREIYMPSRLPKIELTDEVLEEIGKELERVRKNYPLLWSF